jgi:glutathione S-transferase
MMTLWGRKSSINVQKVLWVLAELDLREGADFKQIDAGLHFGINKTPEYLKLNPNGLVPTLEDGSLVLWESNTIMRYLAKKFSSTGAFPYDLASQASSDKWMDWQISTLWPSLRVPFLGLTRGSRSNSKPKRFSSQTIELFKESMACWVFSRSRGSTQICRSFWAPL